MASQSLRLAVCGYKGARLRLITDMIAPHKIREGMKIYIFNLLQPESRSNI